MENGVHLNDNKYFMLGFTRITMTLALLGLKGMSQANPILDRLNINA